MIAAGGNGRIAVVLGLGHNSLVNLTDGTLRRFELPEDCGRRAGGVSVNADSAVIPGKGKGGLNGEVFWSDKDSTTTKTLLTNICGVSTNAVLARTGIRRCRSPRSRVGCASLLFRKVLTISTRPINLAWVTWVAVDESYQ